jgi:hypothetical protein
MLERLLSSAPFDEGRHPFQHLVARNYGHCTALSNYREIIKHPIPRAEVGLWRAAATLWFCSGPGYAG